MSEWTDEQIDAGAQYLARKVMHHSRSGLRVDGRAADREFPAWGVGGHLNARQEDYRDAVRGILAAMSAHSEESSDG